MVILLVAGVIEQLLFCQLVVAFVQYAQYLEPPCTQRIPCNLFG